MWNKTKLQNNLMFWTTVHCLFWLVTYWQTWFKLSRVKLYSKGPEGKQKLVRVIEGSSYQGFELLGVDCNTCMQKQTLEQFLDFYQDETYKLNI